jgi:hypothetical protein
MKARTLKHGDMTQNCYVRYSVLLQFHFRRNASIPSGRHDQKCVTRPQEHEEKLQKKTNISKIPQQN